MKHLPPILYVLLFFLYKPVFAQKIVVLEQIRTYQSNGLATYYWQNKEIAKSIAAQLNQTLLEQRGMVLADTTGLRVAFSDFENLLPPVKPVFRDTDTSHLHLYIDFVEITPSHFYLNLNEGPLDSNLIRRTNTIFQLSALLLKQDKTIVFNETLHIIISTAPTAGIGTMYGDGIAFNNLAILPSVFTELIKSATKIIFNPVNELSTIEMKLQPAFLSDNYLLPKIANRPRTFVTTTKGISTYVRNSQTEIIRFAEPSYIEIKIKGKKAEKYSEEITRAIKNTSNYGQSDFVFLGQDSRDVLRDKNYHLQLTTQIDPANLGQTESMLFTNFLQGAIHFLLQGNDTLAKFLIQKDIKENGGNVTPNKLFANKLYNGYDSTSSYLLVTDLPANGYPILYDYLISGTINHQSFSIKCSGTRKMVKEIFLNNQLVGIAQGKFSPERFVIFDASLSPELLNQLLIIGFNRFLE